MKVLLDIKENKALAFLNFIKSLDFITIDESVQTFNLSKEQKHILEERKAAYEKGESKSYSWQEVKEKLKNEQL